MHTQGTMWGNRCTDEFVVAIISKCIHISSHHFVHFKYNTILYVSYTSIMLEEEKKKTSKDLWRYTRGHRKPQDKHGPPNYFNPYTFLKQANYNNNNNTTKRRNVIEIFRLVLKHWEYVLCPLPLLGTQVEIDGKYWSSSIPQFPHCSEQNGCQAEMKSRILTAEWL